MIASVGAVRWVLTMRLVGHLVFYALIVKKLIRFSTAYDPIFWLHHTNVHSNTYPTWIRLISLSRLIVCSLFGRLYILSNGCLNLTLILVSFLLFMSVRQQTHSCPDLLPFWNTPSTFFRATRLALRDWTELNFTYPEFVGIHPKGDMRSAILKIVDEMYGEEDHPSDDEKSLVSVQSSLTRSLAPIRIPLFAKDQSHADWILRIRTKKYALRMSYSILVFCGVPPTSVADWRTSSTLVGMHSEFVNSQAERCPNCVDRLNVLSEGFINLTKLVEHKCLNDADVEKYLHAHLAWRVQKVVSCFFSRARGC